jgi:hypothetical protein
VSIVSFLAIFVLFCIISHPFLLTAQGGSNNQSLTQPSLAEIGTRFETVGGIFSLPSIDCLGCEFRGIVEKVSESQYSIQGEVVVESTPSIIPVSVLGTLNISDSAINGTLSISDKQYTIEGTRTTYSPTCSSCKQILDLRGQSIQGDDVMSANIPLNSIK